MRPSGSDENQEVARLETTLGCWLHFSVLETSCPPVLSLQPRSVTSYKSNNKNAVTAISATHGLTVNLSLLVLRATNKLLFIKHRNIPPWKHFLENNPTLIMACSMYLLLQPGLKPNSSSFHHSRITNERLCNTVVSLYLSPRSCGVSWPPCSCSTPVLSAVGAAESLTELAGGSRELRAEEWGEWGLPVVTRRERERESPHN